MKKLIYRSIFHVWLLFEDFSINIFIDYFFLKPLAANDVQIAQELLTKLGYTPGPIDGSYGSKTKFALENFYAAQNKKFDGQLKCK